jgi:Nif-specific regulatory protein
MTLQQRLLEMLAPAGASGVAGSPDDPVPQRVVASTSIDLRSLVRQGGFSQELLHVLREQELAIPPLRERREDIPLLCEGFMAGSAGCANRAGLSLSPAALQRLVEGDWPGNVLQLRYVLQLAVLTTTGPVIEAADLALGRAGPAEEWESLRIDHWERRLITVALQRAGGNVPEAAKLLGIGRATLYRKLEEYGIQR